MRTMNHRCIVMISHKEVVFADVVRGSCGGGGGGDSGGGGGGGDGGVVWVSPQW